MDNEYWKKFEKWFNENIERWKADGIIKRVMNGTSLDNKEFSLDKDGLIAKEMNDIFEKIMSKK